MTIRILSAAFASLVLLAATTASAQSAGRVITVSADGSGDFKTIQAAVDSVSSNNATPVLINIAPGRYEERVTVPRGKNFLTLRGTGLTRTNVVITGSAGTWGVLSASGNGFRAENFMVENTAGPTAGPQMALYCDGKRQVFDNLLVKGWQDTLGSWNGNIAYFRNCEIWGSVDFIYSGGTAVFDRCDVVQIRDVGGPIAAPSTPKEVAFGLVFLDCRLLKGPGVKPASSTLMRPWREDGHTAFINCRMDDHISAKGWSEWDGREKTCRAIEFGSKTLSGQPIDLSNRVAWAKILTAEQAAAYSIASVLGGWNPSAVSRKTKFVLVGDSTVTDDAGWGLGFKQFLTDEAECFNTSRGGRSSQSFLTEGRWTNALALKGDYYLIQFGHNNEPGKPGRSTDMPTFVANMKQYVDDARAIGVKPILVTPLTRRQWDKANPGKIKSSLAPYAEEVRKIAAEKNVPLVDLQARSIELCESLGPEKCLEFSPRKKSEDGKSAYDGTHLNAKGYVLFARLVVEELRKNAPELAAVLRSEPANVNPVAPESKFDAVVSADGSGTHATVQAAIAAAPDNATKPFTILIKPGKYEGQIKVPKSKPNIHFLGEELENTILTYNLNVYETNQLTDMAHKGTGVIILGDNFRAERITFENTSGDHGQALALRVDGDRAVFNNCRMLGWQDTLLADRGRQYYTNCYIEGRVDFIFGSATAVFDRCVIHSKNGGYITAASTPAEKPFGYVFLNCQLTGDPAPWKIPAGQKQFEKADVKAYLGRPWRPEGSVAFINCEMGGHIKPEGWHNWGKVTNEATARYVEFGSTGPGANPEARVKWAKQLTAAEAKQYTVETILGGRDGWSPQREK